MSVFFKLFAGLVSTTAVIGSVAGVALRNKPEEKIKPVVENVPSTPANKTIIIAKINTQTGSVQNNPSQLTKLNFNTKKYHCFLITTSSPIDGHSSKQLMTSQQIVDCEISPIIFPSNKSSISFKEIKDLSFWNGENSNIFIQDNWLKIQFDATKISGYEFDFSKTINIYFEGNHQVNLYNDLLIKDNKIKGEFYDLFVAKTNVDSTSNDFQHSANSRFYCSTTDNLTSLTTHIQSNIDASECEVMFFSEEKHVGENIKPEFFNFDNLYQKTDDNYSSKKIKPNQYFVVLQPSTTNDVYEQKPIYYYELGKNNADLTKITTFNPVLPLFGELKNSSINSKNKLFVPEQLIN